jgi:hypothetical protein
MLKREYNVTYLSFLFQHIADAWSRSWIGSKSVLMSSHSSHLSALGNVSLRRSHHFIISTFGTLIE